LATRILGWSASDLDALHEDEVLWETWWTRLDGYRADWEQRGFFSMWRRLTRREMVQARLLNLVDGERRLTNLVHLAELLHAEAVHRQLGPQALVDWLAERRVADPGTVDLDETLLRLESDDAAVRLVTIHRSKGLEYGIVFCPFLNRTEALRRGALLLYHDPAANGQLTCDLSVSPSTQVQSIAEGERMAENLRLAYVALTRARHRCVLVWGGGGGSGKPDTSALSWLLDPPQDLEQRPNSEWIEHLRVHSKARTEEDRTSALLNWQTRVLKDSTRLGLGNDVPHLSLDPMPVVSPASWTSADTRTQDVTGSARRFKGRIDREWTVASFTSLSRGLEYAGPVSDKGQDEIVPASVDPVPVKVRDPFSGVRAGLCLHDIFEQLDFTAAPDMRRAVVVDRLKAHGLFTRNVEERVDRWVELALTLPMPPGFQLCQVANSDRLVELEFHLPLQNLTPERLQSAFQKSRWTDPANTEPFSEWNFKPCHGLLRGFIDVLIRHQGRYYLIDWKSNDLGPVETAYTPETLSRTMVRSQYVLQYHLYAAAADLYLRSRIQNYDYERDFGGALYVFVRGLSPDRPDHGIYWDRPDPTLIASLQSVLIAANPIQAAHAAS
jgi:exodeoxyribonuclease V beta subunit